MNHKKLVVGNWKMNPATLDEAKRIARKVKRTSAALERTETVICPPAPFIAPCSGRNPTKIKNMSIGAQTVSIEENVGPFTGEISAAMLKSLGVKYVIVGHSEQRKRGDTDAVVAQRLNSVLSAGLTPILCVGEAVRDEGGKYLDELKGQIKSSCADVVKRYARSIVIAYEPVWAIGAQEAMKPEDMYETSLFVRKTFADMYGSDAGLKAIVLYGGSVNCRNAADMIKIGKVDGLLVGRESINSVGFAELLKEVDKL